MRDCGPGCHWVVILVLLPLVMGVGGQCVASQIVVTEHEHEPVIETEVVDIGELILGMFEYLGLVRNELWHVLKDQVILTNSGDPACGHIGSGFDLETIKLLPGTWTYPILTNIKKLKKHLLIPANDSAPTLVTSSQFSQAVKMLGLKNEVDMENMGENVVMLSKTLKNFNENEENICKVEQIGQNIAFLQTQLLSKTKKVFDKFLQVIKFFEEGKLSLLQNCLGSDELSLENMLLINNSTYEVCLDRLRTLRSDTVGASLKNKRDISLVSKLLGEGNEILMIEHTLKSAIDNYNNNFIKVSNFDRQIKKSINDIDEELFKIENHEENLEKIVSELKMDMADMKNKMKYYMVKNQHMTAITQILEQGMLLKTLDLLKRAALHDSNGMCELTSCELEIHTTSKTNEILIHRKIVKLKQEKKYVVQCAASSPTTISKWHNTLATKIGNNFLLQGGLIDITNKTAANEEVRQIKMKEKLLGLFIVFGDWIQCLRKDTFWLNEQEMNCEALQIFPLDEEYAVLYSGKTLQKMKIIRENQKIGLEKYRSIIPDGTLENSEEQVVFLHPEFDQWIFNESGNIRIASVTILSTSTLFISACCCGLICFLCPCCQQSCINICSKLCTGIYTLCTSNTYRLRKQNKALRKDNAKSRECLEANMREFRLVEAALQAMGDDKDIVRVITDGQGKSTSINMSSMEDANAGEEDSSEKMARFSKKNESVTIPMKGEKEKTQTSSNV